MTKKGVVEIKPTSGGYLDRSGKYVPEMFPPDPYRLTDPASALAHYVAGSGEARNYYLNSVDTSSVRLKDFPEIIGILDAGDTGTYEISNATVHNFSSAAPFDPHKLSAAAIVGRLKLEANGVLEINGDGQYGFDGTVGVADENYTFPVEAGRDPMADASTWVGRQLSGKPYRVHVIGTQPIHETGNVRH